MRELILFKLDTDEAVLNQRVEGALGVGLGVKRSVDQVAQFRRRLVIGCLSQ